MPAFVRTLVVQVVNASVKTLVHFCIHLLSLAGSGSGTVDCCSLPNPINGRVQFPDTTVGSVANYSCFFGYTLNGTSTRTCEADGEWSGDPPTCDRE